MLQEKCPLAEFYYNRVHVSLPFCKTTYSCNPSFKRKVYILFYLQAIKFDSPPGDVFAAALGPI